MYRVKSLRFSVFKIVYPFIKKDKSFYFALGILKIGSLVLALLGPVLYLVLINDIMIDKKLSFLPIVIGGYVGIYLLQTLVIVLNKQFYNKLFLKFNVKIKKKLLLIYTKMDVKKYESYTVGDLKNRIDSDLGVIEKFFNAHFLVYYYAVTNVVVIAVILIFMNWILALTSFVMVPLSFWFVKVMGKQAQKVSEKQRELQGEYESFLHGTFQNWKQIKANNLEECQNNMFQTYRDELSKLFVKNQIYWFINRAFIAFKDFFITRMNLYFIGGLLIINGHMDVGLLFAFMNYYGQFYNNISIITDSMIGLKNDIPSINCVIEILNIEVVNKPRINYLEDNIFIRNLNFRYNEEQPLVLNGITFSVASKEHIAIVGRSGCGKTTLAKLLVGLYEPLSGEVCFGNTDINKISIESLGRKIGIVLQDPLMFNLTIRENLQFAKKNATDEELAVVCQKVNILDFINSLSEGFNTVIGERGVKLSGGQNQRLSIARTFLQNPDIIVFDESTSSLDSENEKIILEAVAELSKEKTIITIAHRLSTVLGCNRVVVMDKGKVIAIDSHEKLRGKNAAYDMLFEEQYQAGRL